MIRLKNGQIEEAIEKGVFRRNQISLAEEQHRLDNESELDSAEKMQAKIQIKHMPAREEGKDGNRGETDGNRGNDLIG